ncbi:MAG: hypothetical protein OXU66_07345 [Gammaproteobacteria bacterium]|nr:hypothetical protein [Gammaproteobacteria bacterium]MDD9896506.1 hypothetical protein [Gammaproteobacteria bacterium]MDD9958739.1 hypothetical protein [Gammaproteobacteria bacterium]
MKAIVFTWGIGGVLFILLFAIYRLTPMALALENFPMSFLHWFALIFSIVYMAYAEGYKGFHLGFAPRVVLRAIYLQENPRISHVLLAPIFCMGFIYATRKRQLLSIGLTLMIICFIILVRLLPQPWRGILDAGVVAGLSLGVISILYFLYQARNHPTTISVTAEIPGDDWRLQSH